MPTDLIMPKLGLTMEEGTVVRWLAAEGDRVEQGRPIFEVETDKVTVEVEAPATGVLGPQLVAEKLKVPVGVLLARIYADGEQVPGLVESSGRLRATPLARRMAEEAGLDLATVSSISPGGRITVEDVQATLGARNRVSERVFSSPRARKRARELHLNWRDLAGTGPRGRVIEQDVLAAAAARPPVQPTAVPVAAVAPPSGQRITPTSIQRITAERMTQSFHTAPHFYLQVEIRAARLVALREELRPEIERQTGVKLSYTDLLLRSLSLLLPCHRLLNATWEPDGIQVFAEVNLGFATATSQGLLVPVIHNAQALTLVDIARRREDLVRRAREGRLSLADLTGGTFTLTNLGMYGLDSFIPILNPPQSAILAAGAIAERPVGVNGQVVLQPTLNLTLAVDHRVADGAQAAEFLRDLRELLEAPSRMLL